MTVPGRPTGFPFDLKAALFDVDGQEWAVLSFAPETGAPIPGSLSPAERDVLRGLLAGQSNAVIARARGTSIRTVANQVAAVLRKLGLDSRRQLVALFATATAPLPRARGPGAG